MIHKLRFLLSVLTLTFSLTSVLSQNKLLSGTVKDVLSNELLQGASISVIETKGGTIADDSGFFRLTLPQGTYSIRVSYVGYESEVLKINLNADTRQDFLLKPNGLLNEVVISSRKKDINVTRLSMGVEKLNMKEIKKMPALMGEVDVLKALQLLPGVQAATEGGSGFSVRGGSPDQNLILLDNTTVYNPSHLMGFFSVFNNDVIEGIELYKGDIPLRYGGRLSSLLDVETKTEIPQHLRGTGGIGLISSRLMLEGPLGEKTSWLVGGRRSYADLFLKLSSNDALRKSTLYFYDFNAKINHRFSEKDNLALNLYYGDDCFGAEPGAFDYGNAAASLNWKHVFSDKLFGKFSVNYTNYDYGLASKLEGNEMKWKSGITDYMLRADFHQPLTETVDLSYGWSGTFHHFNPGMVTMATYPSYEVEGNNALENGIYISNEQKVNDRLSLKYGLRFSMFQNIGAATVYGYDSNHLVSDTTRYGSGDVYHTYTAFEPRIGLLCKLTDQSSVKANYAHNTQYMQLANNSASGSPLDVWFSAGPNVKPQQVDMFSAGYFHNFNEDMYETSVELYYKDLHNVIDFAEHASLILNQQLEGEVRTGTGKAYGAEFMLRKNSGRLTGFLNYTLSRSERTIPEINKGKAYLAPYDKTHSVNMVAAYELSKKVNVSATWVYSTGMPSTYPTGRFEIDGEYFPIYSGRNEYRRPDYHRLDLSLNYIPNPDSKKRWKGEWNFSIYNAYGKKNPWTISYDQDDVTGMPYAEMFYLFGVVPSITYNFKF